MTKKELEASIAAKANVSKSVAHDVLEAIVSTIKEVYESDDRMVIAGLGIFKRKEVPAHNVRNPQTGEISLKPASSRLAFKVDKNF